MMKKVLMLAAVMLFVAGLGIGGVGFYIYISSRQDCAQAIARAEDITRTATTTTATAEQKKDAEYARKGAVMICENSKERRTNALLFGASAGVVIVIAAALLFLSRRTSRQSERLG